MSLSDLEPEDFNLLLSVGILAPIGAPGLAEATDLDTVAVSESLTRLSDAGLIVMVDATAVLTREGHENLSRRNFRRVRDVGRMLYLWRGSRGSN